MPYNATYQSDISNIINELNNNNDAVALQNFTQYIISIQNIGPFDPNEWKLKWRLKIWEFGELFKKKSPNHFLSVLEQEINNPHVVNREVLEFIRSEIIVYYLPDIECEQQIEQLINRYPYNSEFRHTLGHYYNFGHKYVEAITQYKLAIKIDDNNNYKHSRHKAEQKYLEHLVQEGSYETGKNIASEILSENYYQGIERGAFVDYHRRFTDHIIFQDKMTRLHDEYRNTMRSELDAERRRVIEILGFFSAVVAFILSTVSIAKQFSYQEAIKFVVSLGLTLILFAVSMSILFTKNEKPVLKDIKFWILFVGLILLGFEIFFLQPLIDIKLLMQFK